MNRKYVLIELFLAAAVFALPRILEGIAELRLSRELVESRYTAPLEPAGQSAAEPVIAASAGEAKPSAAPPPEPRELARLFSVPPRLAAGAEPSRAKVTVPGGASRDTPPAAESAAPPPEDGRFRLLGIIRDAQNGEQLYLKEGETGAIVAVGMEDVVDRAGGAYLVRIGDTIFSIRRD
jgi:hypothetical protein